MEDNSQESYNDDGTNHSHNGSHCVRMGAATPSTQVHWGAMGTPGIEKSHLLNWKLFILKSVNYV